MLNYRKCIFIIFQEKQKNWKNKTEIYKIVVTILQHKMMFQVLMDWLVNLSAKLKFTSVTYQICC